MYGFYPYGAAPFAAAPPIVVPAALPMANITLLSPKDSDLATFAAGSQVSSLPVANLQNDQPKKVWRSGGTADYINVSFPYPVAANMLEIDGHNLSALGVVRARASSTLAGATSAPAIDTGWVSAWPLTGKPAEAYWPVPLSAATWVNDAAFQYWRVDIADPSPLKTYIQAGRLVLGRYWQPSLNFDVDGSPLGFDQKDIQVLTDYGQTFTDRRARSAPRIIALKFSSLDKREVLDGIAEMNRLRGMWGDVVCLLNPNETVDFHRQSLRGVFSIPQAHNIVPLYTANGAMWTVTLNLREII